MTNNLYQTLNPKIIAILRGIKPDEIAQHFEALIEAGISAIEIPLNSPAPYESIEIAVRKASEISGGQTPLVGAGTVIEIAQVQRLHNLGANLIVSPNTDQNIIKATRANKMVSIPGIMTPTEAYQAIEAGATALKLFPANIIGQKGCAAIRAILPPNIDILAVGGVDAKNFKTYHQAGANGLGTGKSLYTPGQSPKKTHQKARAILGAVGGITQG